MNEKELLHTLTRVVSTLDQTAVRFAVAGGLAVYARGGPPSDHDVDLFLKEEDIEEAAEALEAAGLRREHPPEDWLTKVYDGDCLVDLIFRPNHRPVTDEMLDRASLMRVGATAAPVLGGTDLLVDKTLVLSAHRCDFAPLLRIARDLREQVDWHRVAEETSESPYAWSFLTLLAALSIIDRKELPMPEEAPQYLVARLTKALAEDPRTAELGVHVTVRGDQVRLSGEVPCANRKADIEAVVCEHIAAELVHNDVRTADVREPSHAEEIR
ncbi:nucleotidyltransferase family protein [Amycolatopsis sp. EV170708-02-1]|uniref:nucleotidyltransferase family protein n=1 Tax=Amycolatopsis sp. EV170708-02-1 TaxID=2919322 RepID=UPI001F0B8C45|nr:nucleotidyltransferase [Amycolatopsis sp. EV170708-02-1]UMP03571.1 nucleotidyltransferase [Amycolatopsis sp. EV170708-02-1]